MVKQCDACINTPPFPLPDLPHHGEFIEHENTKIYTSGPPTATHGLLIIYDIFGFYPQTLHAADILAHGSIFHPASSSPPPPGERQYRVFIPDFFAGDPCPFSWYPDDTPSRAARLTAWIETHGPTDRTVAQLLALQRSLASSHPHITSWGLLGYCWGGYVASFACLAGTPFSAVVQLHPGFAVEVAERIEVPVLAILSEDETEEEWREFERGLKVEGRGVRFEGMVHGFCSARGRLGEEGVRREFDRAYELVLDFLGEKM